MNHLKKEGKTMNQRKKCLCIISLLLMGLLFDIHIEATKVKAENRFLLLKDFREHPLMER